MIDQVKASLSGFLSWHVTNPVRALQNEAIFQTQFDIQCRNRGITNDFFPFGAAASFGLMYFLFRVLTEIEVRHVVEFGSGQSTLLIDRVKPLGTQHICYEHEPAWYELLSSRLKHCEYRLRPLETIRIEGRDTQWYSRLGNDTCDLVLVDGPIGTERFSRYGSLSLLSKLKTNDFLVIFDDCERKGEQDTVAHLAKTFRNLNLPFRLSYIEGRTTQAVFSSGRFLSAGYFC